jgi:hypothetical protein
MFIGPKISKCKRAVPRRAPSPEKKLRNPQRKQLLPFPFGLASFGLASFGLASFGIVSFGIVSFDFGDLAPPKVVNRR